MKINHQPMYKLDLINSCLILVIGILLVLNALSYPTEAYIFPIVVIGIGMAAAAIQCGSVAWNLIKEKNNSKNNKDIKTNLDRTMPLQDFPARQIVLMIVMFVTYLYLVPEIGFFVITWCFLTGLLRLLRKGRTVQTIVIGTAITVLIYLVFYVLLNVPLPRGVFI